MSAPRFSGDVLATISSEMVRLLAHSYGKGPTKAKTYQCDDFLFCVMEDGMTTAERTLLGHGEHDLVRDVRLRFQHHMGYAFTGIVRQLTGREVRTYQSQVLFEPHHTIEIFLLGDPVAPDAEPV
jgi:uncharacterized protein YbcI